MWAIISSAGLALHLGRFGQAEIALDDDGH